jgi:hypothetical protein
MHPFRLAVLASRHLDAQVRERSKPFALYAPLIGIPPALLEFALVTFGIVNAGNTETPTFPCFGKAGVIGVMPHIPLPVAYL